MIPPTQLAVLSELVGPFVQQMLSSKADTEAALVYPNADVRATAISLLTYHWPITPKVGELLEGVLVSEHAPVVRQAAVGGLATCKAGTRDRRVAHILASILRDECEDASVRKAAYLALNALANKHLELEADLVALANAQIPADVNWPFVQSLLEGRE